VESAPSRPARPRCERHDARCQRDHPRRGGQHAHRPAQPRHGGAEGRDLREGRVPQPRRLPQGPDGRGDRQAGRGRGAQAGRHDHRGDQRQHGGLAGADLGDQGLQDHLRDARQDVAGEDLAPARVRLEGRRLPHGGRARGPTELLLGIEAPRPGDAELVLRQPVPQPREPPRPLQLDGPRDLEPDAGRSRRVRGGYGHGRHHHRRGRLSEREEARARDRRRRSSRLALLRLRQERPYHEAVHVQGRGYRRGFLPVDDEPEAHRRDRARRRQGVLPDDARSGAARGNLRGRLGRRGGDRGHQVRAADRPAGEDPRAALRRGEQVPVEDLQRRLDARERLPRGGGRARDRARSAVWKVVERGERQPDRQGARRHRDAQGAGHQPAAGDRVWQAAGHRRRGRSPAAPGHRVGHARLARGQPGRERLRDGHRGHQDRAAAERALRREARHRARRAPEGRRAHHQDRSHRVPGQADAEGPKGVTPCQHPQSPSPSRGSS
jgi:hypothetical protein